jgi:mannose-6-phosphate isomerase-like protein (cupin superfamily)
VSAAVAGVAWPHGSHHDDEDELFLVTKGTMLMQFRDRNVQVNPGEFIIVPRLVEHCPAVPVRSLVILLHFPRVCPERV